MQRRFIHVQMFVCKGFLMVPKTFSLALQTLRSKVQSKNKILQVKNTLYKQKNTSCCQNYDSYCHINFSFTLEHFYFEWFFYQKKKFNSIILSIGAKIYKTIKLFISSIKAIYRF